ncbi:MAG: hypothetical protein Q9166_008214 [cf. Caloplaca sp. 2 TL-2023]
MPAVDLDADTSGRLIGVSAAFIVLEILFVVLREIARRKTSSEYGWDDYLIVPALVTNIGMCIQSIVMARIANVGRHFTVALKLNPDTLGIWIKCVYALEWIYLPAVALPKLSLLSLYLRIFVKKTFRQATYVLMVLIICNWIAFILASTFQCSPVTYQWNKKIRGGHCFNVQLFYRMVNVPNIATDAAMLVLPIPMILSKLSRSLKSTRSTEDIDLTKPSNDRSGFTRLEAGIKLPSSDAVAPYREEQTMKAQGHNADAPREPQDVPKFAIDVTTDIRVESLHDEEGFSVCRKHRL